MKYGYARISTKKQNIERQIRNITTAEPQARIYAEAFTGTTSDRPQWQKLIKAVKPGDTIIFDSVSRMSRNAAEGFADYKNLYEKGIELIFLKESYINTSVYKAASDNQIKQYISTGEQATDTFVNSIMAAVNKFTMDLAERQIMIAFEQAQKEVDDLHKRTSEGIKIAQLRYAKETAEGIPHLKNNVGRQQGAEVFTKTEKYAKEIILKHSKDFGGSLNDSEVMQLAKCSRNSYYKYKKELKA